MSSEYAEFKMTCTHINPMMSKHVATQQFSLATYQGSNFITFIISEVDMISISASLPN